VASTGTHVLIEGEAGTEREVVARAIHVGSPREERPFVKVTCAAFRGDAKERELFGWTRGAFDGAFTERPGRIELAHGGTIYLEEPEVLSPTLQARLLRVLVEGEAERVGATRSAPVDVRVLLGVSPRAAAAWADGGLLPELASRLSVFPLRVPPLRERPEDVAPLAEHFLRKYARKNPRAATSLSPEALDKLTSYAWPGNVRELENAIERAAILARGDVIQPAHLAFASPPRAPLPQPSPPPVAALEEPHAPKDLDSELDAIERRELLAAIERCAGNKAEVARSLGVRRTTLYYRLKRLGIEV
jgi:DNA-binding NtrC family response regulator